MESRSNVVEVYFKKKTYLNTQGKSQIVWIFYVTFLRLILPKKIGWGYLFWRSIDDCCEDLLVSPPL